MRNSWPCLFDRVVRLVCAVAVALVTTFHVCDATRGNAVDLVSVSMAAADDDGKATTSSLAAVEKCHTCAVASLPAVLAAEPGTMIVRDVPAGTVLRLAAFIEPTVGPPPRA